MTLVIAKNDTACKLCNYSNDLSAPAVVYSDEFWMARILDGLEMPGCFGLVLRRHAESATLLHIDEMAGMGQLVATLSAAIAESTRSARVYFASFGERHSHFHILFVPRLPGVASDRRGAKLFSCIKEMRDPETALNVAEEVRSRVSVWPADPHTPIGG
jgi:diadenosine tetraphosphate (Ap4A) HIT family hydrolase